MIKINIKNNAVEFVFTDSQHYLENGTIEVPVNSLALIVDSSDMVTFRRADSDDLLFSANYDEFGMSKDALINLYKNSMVGATGGGGGTVDAYTKQEADNKFATKTEVADKVSWGDLTESLSNQIMVKEVNGYENELLVNYSNLYGGDVKYEKVPMKTINGQGIFGEGDIKIEGGGGDVDVDALKELINKKADKKDVPVIYMEGSTLVIDDYESLYDDAKFIRWYADGSIYKVPYNNNYTLTSKDVLSGTTKDEINTGANKVTGITIGDKVTVISGSTFSGCSGITGNLVIPGTVTSIGSSAFYKCTGFTGSLTIPDSVTSIGNYAFQGCLGFTGTLTIGEGITSIGEYVFSNCTGLTGNLVIPDSVTSIGNYTFQDCSGFTGDLVIPDLVTSIGNSAFSGCSGFNSLTLGKSLQTIGNNAFNGCSGITGSLVIPDSVTEIGKQAFSSCSGFTGSLVIPDKVTEIKDYLFFKCYGLETITLGNRVTSIGTQAFRDCSGLTGSFVIPESVTSIGTAAFYNCKNLTEIIIGATIPPTLGTEVFQYTTFPIYVPAGTSAIYKTAINWSTYASRIQELGGGYL